MDDSDLKVKTWCERILPKRLHTGATNVLRLHTEGIEWAQRWLAAGGQGYLCIIDLLEEKLQGRELHAAPDLVPLSCIVELARRWEELAYHAIEMYRQMSLFAAYTLLRGAWEAVLTAVYINEFPEKGLVWLNGAEFSPGQMRKELGTEDAVRVQYQTLSWVSHANMIWEFTIDNQLLKPQATLGFLRTLCNTNWSAANLFRTLIPPERAMSSDFLGANPWDRWQQGFDDWLAAVESVMDRTSD